MAYTRDQLLTSTKQKHEHVPGVSHTGAPHPKHYAAPGEGLISHPASVPNVAGQTDNTHVKVTLGKIPPIKRAFSTSVPLHSGARTQTRSGGEAFGADHSSAIDALTGTSVVPGKDGTAPNHPLVAPPVAKNYAPAKPVMGHRSRVNDSSEGSAADAWRGIVTRDTYHSEVVELSRRIFEEATGPTQSGHVRKRDCK